MDLDAYRAAHEKEWGRLERLASQRRLSGAEADELIALYQSGASDLSVLQAAAGTTVDSDRLSVLLSRARLRFTGAGSNMLRHVADFVVRDLPAALYRVRWLTLAVALATVGMAAAWAVWLLGDPQLLLNLASESDMEYYAEHAFTEYYTENAPGSFAGQVWTNNAFIAAQCVAFGIVGFWVPYVIAQNAQGLGQSAAIMIDHGRGGDFFLYIAPHGLLELTAVFVAAAAGLRIFWSWISPGHRTRAQALAEDGRSLIAIAIGLVGVLFISGLIEGFVTGSALPWAVKIGIGAAALLAFLAYMIVLGGRAHRAGSTGDLDPFDAGQRRVYAG